MGERSGALAARAAADPGPVRRRTDQRASTGLVAWLVQRAAAVLLLVLVPLKVWSGWAFTGTAPGGPWLAALHVNPWVDVLLLAAVAFHALYGIRTIVIELGGASAARGLFVAATAVAFVVTVMGAWVSLAA